MAERKAVNKYYPPEWTPKQGSINKFKGTHALRERARKLDQGILIIRFEMPYNIWCEGCKNHIGMGVRYNAEKSKVGMYYTTPIYKFRMKCHLCNNHFEIQTDPQNLDYTVLNGARRQERRWDPSTNEQVAPDDKDISKKMATDAMFKLEHGVDDKDKKKKSIPAIVKLELIQEKWKDDYAQNQMLRNKFRKTKKELKAIEESDKTLLMRSSLDIPLLPETAEDAKLAGLLRLAPVDTFEERQLRKRIEIDSRPLFGSSTLNYISQSINCKSINGQSISDTKNKIVQLIAHQKIQETAKIKSLDSKQLGIIKINNNKTTGNESVLKEETNLNSSLVSGDYDSDDSK